MPTEEAHGSAQGSSPAATGVSLAATARRMPRKPCEGCGLKTPHFGLPSEGRQRWCLACSKAHPGTTQLRKLVCEDCKTTAPHFGLSEFSEASNSRRWCAGCAKNHPEAIYLEKKAKCEDCRLKGPSYGLLGTSAHGGIGKKRWCASCAANHPGSLDLANSLRKRKLVLAKREGRGDEVAYWTSEFAKALGLDPATLPITKRKSATAVYKRLVKEVKILPPVTYWKAEMKAERAEMQAESASVALAGATAASMAGPTPQPPPEADATAVDVAPTVGKTPRASPGGASQSRQCGSASSAAATSDGHSGLMALNPPVATDANSPHGTSKPTAAKAAKGTGSRDASALPAKAAAGPITAAKDPNKPKKALTPYLCFTSVRRVELTKEDPSWRFKQQELIVEMAREWKTLSDEAKKPHEATAAEDKLRHGRQMKHYKPPPPLANLKLAMTKAADRGDYAKVAELASQITSMEKVQKRQVQKQARRLLQASGEAGKMPTPNGACKACQGRHRPHTCDKAGLAPQAQGRAKRPAPPDEPISTEPTEAPSADAHPAPAQAVKRTKH